MYDQSIHPGAQGIPFYRFPEQGMLEEDAAGHTASFQAAGIEVGQAETALSVDAAPTQGAKDAQIVDRVHRRESGARQEDRISPGEVVVNVDDIRTEGFEGTPEFPVEVKVPIEFRYDLFGESMPLLPVNPDDVSGGRGSFSSEWSVTIISKSKSPP